MTKSIYISLPVADVAHSAAFFTAIGFEQDPGMYNPQAAAMKWGDAVTINAMSHELFGQIIAKPIGDARAHSFAAFALPMDSRDAVDAIAAAALAAGGREVHGAEDEGFLYSRGFEDPDGHAFGPFHMDMAAFEAMQAAQAPA